jgi:ribonuclease HI
MNMPRDTEDAIAEHLLRNERALLDPAVRRDRARVSALLAADFVEIGSSGRLWTRDEILDSLSVEEFRSQRIEDYTCRQIADGVILASYRTERTDTTTGERSSTLRSSIWTKEPNGWLLRFHQGTRAA